MRSDGTLNKTLETILLAGLGVASGALLKKGVDVYISLPSRVLVMETKFTTIDRKLDEVLKRLPKR